MSNEYAKKVEILLRMIPIVTEESVFAVHGGSAINLFVRNLPRYSVDLDLTYIPLEDRSLSLTHINEHLSSVARKAKKALRGIHIVEKPDICKLIPRNYSAAPSPACLPQHPYYRDAVAGSAWEE